MRHAATVIRIVSKVKAEIGQEPSARLKNKLGYFGFKAVKTKAGVTVLISFTEPLTVQSQM